MIISFSSWQQMMTNFCSFFRINFVFMLDSFTRKRKLSKYRSLFVLAQSVENYIKRQNVINIPFDNWFKIFFWNSFRDYSILFTSNKIICDEIIFIRKLSHYKETTMRINDNARMNGCTTYCWTIWIKFTSFN